MTIASNKASSESNSNDLKKDEFPSTAPAAYPVFFRSYSRKKDNGKRENWSEVGERNLSGLQKLGDLSEEELTLMKEMQENQKAQQEIANARAERQMGLEQQRLQLQQLSYLLF